MGLWEEVRCPACGAEGARKFLWRVKCPNRKCSHYDLEVMREVEKGGRGAPAPAQQPSPPLKGGFDPGADSVSIRYRNFRGEEKTFVADRTTSRSRGKHISFKMAPTGRRVALARNRILNWEELEEAIRPYPEPTSEEAQILGYYGKHPEKHSPRYEELRREYPRR